MTTNCSALVIAQVARADDSARRGHRLLLRDMAVVAAEIFGVAGVGQRMMQASSLLATDIVVVYMLTMAGLYGFLDTLFVAFQRWVLRWKA